MKKFLLFWGLHTFLSVTGLGSCFNAAGLKKPSVLIAKRLGRPVILHTTQNTYAET